jgi:hypothetical protein
MPPVFEGVPLAQAVLKALALLPDVPAVTNPNRQTALPLVYALPLHPAPALTRFPAT